MPSVVPGPARVHGHSWEVCNEMSQSGESAHLETFKTVWQQNFISIESNFKNQALCFICLLLIFFFLQCIFITFDNSMSLQWTERKQNQTLVFQFRSFEEHCSGVAFVGCL